MAQEKQTAELLRGYQIIPHPDAPTVKILRLDTENSQSYYLVTKEILQMLVDELQGQLDKFESVQ